MVPKHIKITSKKRVGGTSSSEEQKKKEKEEAIKKEEAEKEIYFGPFVYGLPKEAFTNIVSHWNTKGSGPKFDEKYAMKVIEDAGYFPVCWNLDKDLYPFLQHHPEYAKMIQPELTKQYTKNRYKNIYNDEGVYSLLKAAERGEKFAIQGLLNAGVDVNASDGGWTSLHWVAKKGYKECLRLLLKVPGIQVNAVNHSGNTPLHIAAHWDQKDSVQLLLEAPGIRVNAKDEEGNTPLHKAALQGNESCLLLLLKAPGISINAKNKVGKTALQVAKTEKIREIIRNNQIELKKEASSISSSTRPPSTGGKPK